MCFHSVAAGYSLVHYHVWIEPKIKLLPVKQLKIANAAARLEEKTEQQNQMGENRFYIYNSDKFSGLYIYEY